LKKKARQFWTAKISYLKMVWPNLPHQGGGRVFPTSQPPTSFKKIGW